MVLNDKILTALTAVFLAVGGGTASLFLGDHADQQEIVVASVDLSANTKSTNAEPKNRTVSDGVDVAALSPDAAAVRPEDRTNTAGLDILDRAPELADLGTISNIVLTRSLTGVAAPTFQKIGSLVSPEFTKTDTGFSLPLAHKVSCALDLRATPLGGARVLFSLSAPCNPNSIAVIEHGGLRFKEKLDANGTLQLTIPVFQEYSHFDVELADGTSGRVGAYIAGLSSLDRVGISWAGKDDTFLHALSNNAPLDSELHVWRLNPRSLGKARINGGGYMVMLGNPDVPSPELAQIFTLPHVYASAGQYTSLQIETLRGDVACGNTLGLQVVQHAAEAGHSKKSIDVALPKCDTTSDSMLLKNVLKDMKVAAK